MMIYEEVIFEEQYVGTATTVQELISLLSENVPADATVDMGSSCHCSDAEVWYDKDTNTVILK